MFNNMVVLSRASWVQDDCDRVCDERGGNGNEHKTVSAKQVLNVVVDTCGVKWSGRCLYRLAGAYNHVPGKVVFQR